MSVMFWLRGPAHHVHGSLLVPCGSISPPTAVEGLHFGRLLVDRSLENIQGINNWIDSIGTCFSTFYIFELTKILLGFFLVFYK